MYFYVTVRPMCFDKNLVFPDLYLNHAFAGLIFEHAMIAQSSGVDGRALYEIRLDDGYTEEEAITYKDVLIEGLSMFGVHAKTLESAKTFAEYLTGGTWNIVDDRLEMERE